MTSESRQLLSMMESGPSLGTPDKSKQELVPEKSGDSGLDSLMLLLGGEKTRALHFSDLPTCVVQTNIFRLFGSKDLFKLRQVCTEWNDMIKNIWCQVVKEEMLEQV